MVESVTKAFSIQLTMNPLSIGYRTLLNWRIKQERIFPTFLLYFLTQSIFSNPTPFRTVIPIYTLQSLLAPPFSYILRLAFLITWVLI